MNISVIIPAYNRVGTIARAIESVLAQTYKPREIIVVDDGSSDATSEVVKMYDEVSLLRQKNMGVSAARNNGVMMAESEWIAFLDSDDTWQSDKLQKQLAFHKQNLTCKVSYTDETWIRNDHHVKIPKKFQKGWGDLYERSLEQCIIAPSSVMIEKKLYDRMEGFDETLEVCEDYDLWLRIMKHESFGLLNEALINKHGGHDDQLSAKHWGMDRFRIRALEALHVSYHDDTLLLDVMIEKYQLLLIGAKKHERYDDAFHYEQRILELKGLSV
ncbi:MAG: glycosyltransferase family A protein [Campylobacterota bacterium]|nr:glycosyltransferase family A protein [Campylobacterota bacterium]